MSMIKKVINKIVKSAGYQINRLPVHRFENFESKNQSAGVVVELIGPTGIGKTTLFKSLHSTLAEDWYFRGHI